MILSNHRIIIIILSSIICYSLFYCLYKSASRLIIVPEKPIIKEFPYSPARLPNIYKIDPIIEIALSNYALPKVITDFEETDVKEISRRVRLFKEIMPIPTNRITSELGRVLERQLYGYALDLYGSVTSIARSFYGGGRGIVVTTGDAYFQFAVHIVRSLKILNCSLPVEIWYNGRGDLNTTNTDFLKKFHNIKVNDINEYFKVPMQTWDIKPFAVLASSFEEVLLLDADCVFLKDPSLLFNDPGYLKDGALFFNDRSLFPGQKDKVDWVRNLLPEPLSARVKSLRMFKGSSQYEQESGVVLIDKRRHFHGLLATCKLNSPGALKEMIREQTHGEKETFWLGLEMANEAYSFMPSLPGSLGTVAFNEKDKSEELCGKLAHFDRDGNLLWFNDAISASKLPDDFIHEVPELTHYAKESEGVWESLCLRKCIFHKVDPERQEMIERLKRLYTSNPKLRVKKKNTENNES